MKKIYHFTYWLITAVLISSCSLDDVDIGQKDSFVKFFDIGEGYAMEETSDGGFILIGTFEDINTTEAQIFKVDDGGNLEWIQRYDNFFGRGVKVLPSGGYVFVGDRIKNVTGQTDPVSDMLIVITDTQGNLQDSVTFTTSLRDHHANAVTFDTDGNLLVLGTFEDANDFDQIVLLKYNVSTLNQIWVQSYGVSAQNSETSKSVHLNTSGTEIVWAGNVSTSDETTVFSLIRIYAAQPNSQITNGQDQGDGVVNPFYFTQDISKTFIGFAIIGTRIVDNDQDIFLLRTDGQGNIIASSERTFAGPGDDDGNSVFATAEGGLIVLGTRETPAADPDDEGKGGKDFFLIKTDGSGNKLWEKIIGGEGDEEGAMVRQTMDGSYAIFGTTTTQGVPRMTLVKTDERGEIN